MYIYNTIYLFKPRIYNIDIYIIPKVFLNI